MNSIYTQEEADPVITFEKPYTHDGSVFGLLGDNPSQEMLDLYSNQKQVTPDTPPAFILAATDDFLHSSLQLQTTSLCL